MANNNWTGDLNLFKDTLPKTRVQTFEIDGREGAREINTAFVDPMNVMQADLVYLLRKITVDEIKQQQKIDNPPSRVIVDGMENKLIRKAERKTEVIFGHQLNFAIMRKAESALLGAIKATTKTKSGKLSSKSSWEWYLIRRDRNTGAHISTTKNPNPKRIQQLGSMDQLILMPKLKYATVVNSLVTQHQPIEVKHRKRGDRPARTSQRHHGFMRRAADAIRAGGQNSLFSGFNVRVMYTDKHALPDELFGSSPKSPVGKKRTIFLMITARSRRRGYSKK